MGWWKLGKKANQYVQTKANMEFDEHTDPAVQLQQTMVQAGEQDRTLRSQAALVIANQKTAEMRLHRAVDALAEVKQKAAQALVMIDQTTDPTKKDQFNRAAEGYANQMIALEKEVESDTAQVQACTDAAYKAHEAVNTNAATMQKRIADQHELLSKLDQAKMQETMNQTLGAINATMSDVVPTMDQVRDKIEARYAKAIGTQEIAVDDVTHAQLEIEHESAGLAAQARLSELRTQLGLGTGGSVPSTNSVGAPSA